MMTASERDIGGSFPVGVRAAAWAGIWIGLLVAVALLVAVGFVFPDGGPTGVSLRQGLGIGLVVAAPPVSVLLARRDSQALVAMGGGLVVAAVATMLGGSWPLALAAVPGCVLLAAGAKFGQPLSWVVVVRLALTSVALIAGLFLAMPGDALLTAAAIGFGALVVISGRATR